MSRPLPDSEAYEIQERRRTARRIGRALGWLALLLVAGGVFYVLAGGPLPAWMEAL